MSPLRLNSAWKETGCAGSRSLSAPSQVMTRVPLSVTAVQMRETLNSSQRLAGRKP